ncbi:MAG TPA: copper-containing nitrite reductase [Candidatus Bathyarchaeia archaeon]|nr:copper-containing nitrite reductase [Candidatus Bathyarchaeia archaeon]
MLAFTSKNLLIILAVISISSLFLAAYATIAVIRPNAGTVSSGLPKECALGISNIARNATDIPRPLSPGPAMNRTIMLETKENCAEIASGSSYQYWTFNGTVPGPLLRVRVNDTVTIIIHNSDSSRMTHSIDLHSVIGPGGGMMMTQTDPGQTTRFWFKALHPGLYVYHCATPLADMHIANGMYGMTLVEPQGGLTPVDKEYYVMQGEFYTAGTNAQSGHHEFSFDKQLTGIPDYVVFNGRVGALTGLGALKAQVGQKIRIYFGVGGPNLDSYFHVIGEVFDKVYPNGSTDSGATQREVQTVIVAPGGSTIAELTALVPGNFSLVNHSLTWALQKGAIGTLTVTGTMPPGIFGQ